MDNARAAWLLSVPMHGVALAMFLALTPLAEAQAAREMQAEGDEAAFAFDRALLHHEEAVLLDPTTAVAARAETRIAALRARSEGNFEPLAKLERVRRAPELARDAVAIDTLVRDSDAFPPGLVRVETWILAADAYDDLGRPNEATALRERVVIDPHADSVATMAAARALVTHYLARGEFSLAAGAARDPKLAREVRAAAWRHRLHFASIAVLGLVLSAALGAVARAARRDRTDGVLATARRSARLVLGFAGYLAGAGSALAFGYDNASAKPFLFFGAALVPLLLIARVWNAAGSPSSGARALRATLCSASVLGAAFLILESLDVRYLRGIGL